MTEKILPASITHFAPAARDAADEFARKANALKQVPLLSAALDTIPSMVLVLNANRQIVIANATAMRKLRAAGGEVLQKRPGEAIGCIHAHDGPAGCGTDFHCMTCGAVQAILESQECNVQVVRDCRILAQSAAGTAALDVKVTATPIAVEGERFTVLAIEDVSQRQRLAVLQRVFFHDVLNTAGCIQGYAQCLAKGAAEGEVPELLVHLSEQLVEEVKAQRDLMAAESGELEVYPEPIETAPLLDELTEAYSRNAVARERSIVLENVWVGTITTDRLLLLRILGNMIKNALEATARGGCVYLACDDCGDAVRFSVRNREVMPPEVQLQVFQRSFSTKGGPGRGIGTYSMKLLGERYLGGEVAFASAAPQGTTFTLTLAKD